MLPNFIVIGAAKAGTTSLYHYLSCHPEVHMSPVKETNFFSEPTAGRPLPSWSVRSRAKYEGLFQSALPARGEASPSYSLHPWRAGVPERISAVLPDVKLIYLVRDPVGRAVSHYLQRAAMGAEHQPLNRALADVDEPSHRYISGSRYATQLQQYLRHFPEDSLMVVDQADLLGARAETLRAVFDFLAVDRDFSAPEFDRLENTSADKRRRTPAYAALQRIGAAAPAPARARLAQVARRALTRPLPEQQLDPRLHERLQESFEPEVAWLRTWTGKTFATWAV